MERNKDLNVLFDNFNFILLIEVFVKLDMFINEIMNYKIIFMRLRS
jgi:hypothetical protein